MPCAQLWNGFYRTSSEIFEFLYLIVYLHIIAMQAIILKISIENV